MTVDELYKLLSKEIGEVKQLNQIEHMRILARLDELHEINGEHALAIKGLEVENIQCREHRKRHWTIFLLVIGAIVSALVSIIIQLSRL